MKDLFVHVHRIWIVFAIKRCHRFRVESNLWLVDQPMLTRDIQFHSGMSAL